jgi:hypothetical protein
MSREVHVRFWERLGVRIPRATRQFWSESGPDRAPGRLPLCPIADIGAELCHALFRREFGDRRPGDLVVSLCRLAARRAAGHVLRRCAVHENAHCRAPMPGGGVVGM